MMNRTYLSFLFFILIGIFSRTLASPLTLSPNSTESPWYLGLWVPEPTGQEGTVDKLLVKNAKHPHVMVTVWSNGQKIGPIEGNRGTSRGNGVIDFIHAVFKGPDGGKYSIELKLNRRDETLSRVILTHHGSFGDSENIATFRRKKAGSVAVPSQPLPLGAKNPGRVNPQVKKPIRVNPSTTKPKPPVRVNPNLKPTRANPTKPSKGPGSVSATIENCKGCSKYFISLYGDRFNDSQKVISGNQVVFKNVPAGSYTVYVSYGGKTDAVVPITPTQKKIRVLAGDKVKVTFRHR